MVMIVMSHRDLNVLAPNAGAFNTVAVSSDEPRSIYCKNIELDSRIGFSISAEWKIVMRHRQFCIRDRPRAETVKIAVFFHEDRYDAV